MSVPTKSVAEELQAEDVKMKEVSSALASTSTSGGGKEREAKGRSAQDNDERGGDPNGEQIRALVYGLPKYWRKKELEKILAKHKLTYRKAHKIPNRDMGVITCNTVEERSAICALRGEVVKGTTLTVDDNPGDILETRKRQRDQDNRGDRKRARKEPQCIADVVTPLHRMTMEQQLAGKNDAMQKILRQIIPRTRQASRYSIPTWLLGGWDCRYDGIIPTQSIGYRNKSQFNISSDGEGPDRVGFTMGQQRFMNIQIVQPKGCLHVPAVAVAACALTQRVVEESPLPAYSIAKREGYWRQLTVRNNNSPEQVMVVVQVCEKDYTKEQCKEERERLVKWYLAAKEEALKLKQERLSAGRELDDDAKEAESMARLCSLFIQVHDGMSMPDQDLECELLWGETEIEETLLGLKFKISPNSFFQCNTDGAEKLYRVVAQWLEDCRGNGEVDVVDVCCGTGTIGLAVAKSVRHVVGVELCEAAVLDARRNAALNDITNCDFVVGRVEDVLKGVLTDYVSGKGLWSTHASGDGVENQGSNTTGTLVGIVDPPRAGLHSSVVKSIRECEVIRHLIYVSCNQNSLLDNVVDLSRGCSTNVKGLPFRPICAVAVDMFPHTRHNELVVLFERVASEMDSGPVTISPRIMEAYELHSRDLQQDDKHDESANDIPSCSSSTSAEAIDQK